MDTLDRLALLAIILLVISSSALISHNIGEAKPAHTLPGRASEVNSHSDESDPRTKTIRDLIEGNKLAKAELLTRELMRITPYNGEPRMLMGDILLRKQKIIESVLEYKEAVDLNPDYLDKKTPSFQGRKLKIAVNEALTEVDKKMKLGAGEEMKKVRKSIYYLQRRIAGSCG